LSEEDKLMEIVKLVGADVLPDDQKLVIEIAKVIRVGFLQQNAFHKDDTFVPLEKQKKMMKVILYLNKRVRQLVSASIPISRALQSGIFDKLTRIKYDVPNDKIDMIDDYKKEIDTVIDKIISEKA
jgi:V/A-type H+-transporting ATPase subunit A